MLIVSVILIVFPFVLIIVGIIALRNNPSTGKALLAIAATYIAIGLALLLPTLGKLTNAYIAGTLCLLLAIPVALLIAGIITLRRNPYIGKLLLIFAIIYIIIGLGLCAIMLNG